MALVQVSLSAWVEQSEIGAIVTGTSFRKVVEEVEGKPVHKNIKDRFTEIRSKTGAILYRHESSVDIANTDPYGLRYANATHEKILEVLGAVMDAAKITPVIVETE